MGYLTRKDFFYAVFGRASKYQTSFAQILPPMFFGFHRTRLVLALKPALMQFANQKILVFAITSTSLIYSVELGK
jgi:hypothetical protein